MADKEIGTLKIGDKIEIYKKYSSEKEIYPSKILDILEDNKFVISGPMKKHNLIFLHNDEIVTVVSLIENKGRYEFDAKVISRYLDKVYKVKLQKISEIRKIQLREYYRFNISIPVIKRFTVKKETLEESIIEEECRTKDISGGGLRLLTNYAHNIGDIIECEFKIEGRIIISKAKIIRVEPVDTFEYKYGMGIQFIDINERDRDAIVKFIFTKERELREKGLI